MTRYIDADALIKRMKEDNMQTSKLQWLRVLAECAPIIDAVEEVVWCKSCKHKESCRQSVTIITRTDTRFKMEEKPVTYCSYGQKEDE